MSNTAEYKLSEIFPVSISGEWGSDPTGEGNALALRAADFTKDCKLRPIVGAPRNIPKIKLGNRILKDGDILIEKSGGSPEQPVGRAIFFDRDREGLAYVHSNFLQLLRVADDFDSKFSYYLMVFLYFSGRVFRYQQQTTGIINLKLENYLSEKVVVPALPTQRRIQYILSTIDQAIEKTEAMIEKYQQIKAGLMHDLFTRGVTADGHLRPPREQAPELYQQTSIGWIPKEWNSKTLISACDWFSGGTPSKQKEEWWKGSLPWMSPKDMKHFELSDTEDHVTREAALSGSRIAPKNTVFIVVRGMILAHSFPVVISGNEFSFNQDVKAVIAKPCLSNRYLAHWFVANTDLFLKKTTESTHGTKRFDLKNIYNIEIGVPPESEQQRIIARMNVVESRINSEKIYCEKLRKQKSGLMHDLLTGKVRVKLDSKTSEMAGG